MLLSILGTKRKADKTVEDLIPKCTKKDLTSNWETEKKADNFYKILTNSEGNPKNKQKNNRQTSLNSFLKLKTNINSEEIVEIETSDQLIKDIIFKQEVKIFSWNINGFKDKMNKGAIEKFILKETPNILCLNEIKIDNNVLKKEKYEELFLKKYSYSTYWNCCKIRGNYSGVAIFTKTIPDNIYYGINIKEYDQEGRVLTLEFENYFLVSAYVPNSGQNLKRLEFRTKQWDIEFRKYIENLKMKKDVILCGDLNVAHKEIDIFSPKGHLKYAGFTLEERDNFNEFLKHGFIDTLRHLNPNLIKFSYFNDKWGKKNLDNNKGWRLDYFIINKEASTRVVSSEIFNDDASDHSPIKLIWKI